MKRNNNFQRAVIVTCAALMLAGCATTNGGRNGQTVDNTSGDPCSMGSTAMAGALAGALLGGLKDGKKGIAKGALLGGALGAVTCLAINVTSRQSKTAAQADNDYKQARGALPPEPMVSSYTSRMRSPSLQRGQTLQVNSSLELVNGSVQPIRMVREELEVFTPDGSPIKTTSKPFIANSAGRFENSFDVTIPASAPQGMYALKTKVYVNDKLSGGRDLQTQVVWDGSNAVLVASQ